MMTEAEERLYADFVNRESLKQSLQSLQIQIAGLEREARDLANRISDSFGAIELHHGVPLRVENSEAGVYTVRPAVRFHRDGRWAEVYPDLRNPGFWGLRISSVDRNGGSRFCDSRQDLSEAKEAARLWVIEGKTP